MARNCQCVSPKPGDWVKGKIVGSGAFGTVRLAMNKATGALFVAKSAKSEAGLKSLENEATILENLNSPHIVKCLGGDLLDSANGEKEPSLFMEYMAGGNLSDVVEKFGGALDERVIRLYTREILLGLKYLHENGIVHCDLKGKNILFDAFGKVKLADFGCARRVNDSKSNGPLLNSSNFVGGTPLWMSPEILRNERLDYSADIWSLGCTIIEMATGRPPWGDDEAYNPMALVMKIVCSEDMPMLPSGFSKAGLDFLTKCLDRNPKKRWSVAELLNHQFVSGIEKVTSSSREEGVRSPASVLDFGIYEDGYEYDEPTQKVEFKARIIPFLTRCCEERGGTSWSEERDSDFDSSGKWVTVRSI